MAIDLALRTSPVLDFDAVLYAKRCGGHEFYAAMTPPWLAGTLAPATCLLSPRLHGRAGSFIEVLGLEPTAPEWSQMARLGCPTGRVARTRRYGGLLSQLPSEEGA